MVYTVTLMEGILHAYKDIIYKPEQECLPKDQAGQIEMIYKK